MDRFLGLVKIFIVVAAICLVLGTTTLVWKLFTREVPTQVVTTAPVIAPPQPGAEAIASAGAAPGQIAPGAGQLTPSQTEVHAVMPVPPGAVVIDMRMQGDRALLLLRTPAGDDYLSLIDPATGRRFSLLRLEQDAAHAADQGEGSPPSR